ncbi:MAG: monovalent cation/H(+) antiporter subunit G [Bacteroidota bacterium]
MMTIVISFFLIGGSAFILLAALGTLRFPDMLSWIHATTKATSFGLLLVLIGVALFFNTLLIYFKALLVISFIYLTAPLAAHSIARVRQARRKDK